MPRALVQLPAPATRLLGRERELAQARAILTQSDGRLLTLTGPGGAGKTRLGIAIARDLAPLFAHGTLFVDLSGLVDPALVPSRIAQGLGVKESRDQPLVERIQRHLRGRSVLLLLDNFEQVIDAAPIVADLLEASPGVRIVATSRETLRLRGEQILSVPPLDLPDLARLPRADLLAVNPSVALFVERLRAVDPEFDLIEADARIVAEICVQLDGLPLAIELAAGRGGVLRPRSILERLRVSFGRLDLLSVSARDVPSRQQTLRNAIRWSYDLLDEHERELLTHVSVFVGGWTAAGALAVHSNVRSEMEMLDRLGSLVAKSLLRRDTGTLRGESRFRMFETIREFAAEQLAARGESAVVRHRHAAFMLAFAEQAEPLLLGPEQVAWFETLGREHANLQAALTWSFEVADADLALRLSGALWKFWEVHGHLREARQWLAGALALAEQTSSPIEAGTHAKALDAAAHIAFLQAEYAAAREWYDQSLQLRRGLSDDAGAARCLNGLGLVEMCLDNLDQAAEKFEQAVVLNRTLGNRTWESINLNNLGRVAYYRGEHAEAIRMQEESLSIGRDVADRWGVGLALADLGDVLVATGQIEAAIGHLRESLAIWEDLSSRWGIAYVFESLAGVAASRGDFDRVTKLLGAARALRDEIGEPTSPVREVRLNEIRQMALGEADEATRDAAMADDQPVRQQKALAIAREMLDESANSVGPTAMPTIADVPRAPLLSPREQEVAALVARGLTNRQIANELVISERTADAHVARILSKLGFASRTQVATWAVRQDRRSDSGA